MPFLVLLMPVPEYSVSFPKFINAAYLWRDFDGAAEVSDCNLWVALAEVDVAQIGVGARAVRFLLQYDLKEALCLPPALLCGRPHTCHFKGCERLL